MLGLPDIRNLKQYKGIAEQEGFTLEQLLMFYIFEALSNIEDEFHYFNKYGAGGGYGAR